MIEHGRIRFDLCCAARLLYRNGLSAANAGHISVAIGGNRMLVNHFERLHQSDPDLFAGKA